MPDLRKLIEEYLDSARLMQLATAIDNQPWICSVWYAFDQNLNIYWFSSITRRHSQELKTNNKVAGAIVLPQQPSDPPRGLQFEGVALELNKKEDVSQARSNYQNRIFDGQTIDQLIANPVKPHRFYQVRPAKFVLFDTVNFPDNARQELIL